MNQPVRFEMHDHVAIVELNRPHRLNAITDHVVRGLLASFERAAGEGARAVILAGAGRSFCSGHDLKEPEPQEDAQAFRARLERLQDVTRTIKALPVPVIAAVQGWAVGAGAEFALACDLVIAAADTRFAFPEVGVGLAVTNGISQILGAALGPQRAKYLLMTGATFTAQDALNWGLVNAVVPAGEERRRACLIAKEVLGQPPVALGLAKRAIDSGIGATLEESLSTEVELSLLLALREASDGAEKFQKESQAG
jgi:2-(1,2-epoxy-1,2-dihydrophenyl)acetyl-CoA isomerase